MKTAAMGPLFFCVTVSGGTGGQQPPSWPKKGKKEVLVLHLRLVGAAEIVSSAATATDRFPNALIVSTPTSAAAIINANAHTPTTAHSGPARRGAFMHHNW